MTVFVVQDDSTLKAYNGVCAAICRIRKLKQSFLQEKYKQLLQQNCCHFLSERYQLKSPQTLLSIIPISPFSRIIENCNLGKQSKILALSFNWQRETQVSYIDKKSLKLCFLFWQETTSCHNLIYNGTRFNTIYNICSKILSSVDDTNKTKCNAEWPFIDYSCAGVIFGVQPDCSVQKRMVHISNIWYVIFVTNLQNLYLSLMILRNVLLTY